MRCSSTTCSSTAPVVKSRTFLPKPQKAFLICVLFFTSILSAQEDVPESVLSRQETWQLIEQAKTDVESGDYAAAAEAFATASESAPEGEVDVDALRLAAGQAWLKSGDATKAFEVLESIEGFDIDSLRSQTRLSQGNAAYQIAQQALTSQDLEAAKTQSETAQNLFRSALQANPSNADAAHNLELTQRFIQQLPEPPPQEQQDQEEQEDSDEQDQDDQEQESQDQQDQNQESQEQQENQEPQDGQDQESEQNQEKEEQDSQESQEDSGDQQEEQESQPNDADPSDASQGESSDMEDPRDYSEEQARQLLDTYDEQERRQRRQFLQQQSRSIPVEKDW